MPINLASPFRRVAFAIICLAMAGAYVGWAVRPLLGSRHAGSLERDSIERAIGWEPGNAEHRAQLGRYFMFIAQDAPAAVQQYQAATALNPHSARYWLDLANAYQFTGDTERQREALEHALQDDPTTPDVAWEAANFFLVQGDVPRALRGFRVVLAADPYKVRPALELCWRVTRNADTVLGLLPPDPATYMKFVQLLTAGNESAAAERAWTRMIALGIPLEPRLAFPYFEYLVRRHEVTRARGAWKELAGVTQALEPYVPGENLMVNGGFKEEILNGGFDWQYRSRPGVAISLDTTEFHDGSRSLALTFDGEQIADAGLWQLVAVDPNTRYEFSAFVKADDIRSASGPRLAISDAYTGTPLLETAEVLGSSVWQEVSSELQTRGETSLVTIRVVRSQGTSRIRGRLWLDDLKLVRK